MKKASEPREIVLAEFADSGALIRAARALRDAGYSKFDCHSPFPIHGMNQAMGLRRSPIGWLAGLAAIIGCSVALTMQWWTMAVDYPLVIAGKPFFAYQAYVPVTFALGVIGAAFVGLFGMLVINRLPRYNHPVFNSENFIRVTDDSFFVTVESSDPKYDSADTQTFLETIGGKNPEVVRDE
jgi:hypothetical protein